MGGISSHINELVLKEHGSYNVQHTGQDTVKAVYNTPSFLNGDADTFEETQAFSPYINWAKVWQLAISYGNVTPSATSNLWGNWRLKSSGSGQNKLQLNGLCYVNEKVQLISEDLSNIGFKFSNHYSEDISIKNLVNNKGVGKSISKVFDTIDKAVDAASMISYTAAGFLAYDTKTNQVRNESVFNKGSQKVINKYSNAKGWNGPGTMALNNSELVFKFKFGQAGLYDALEEVFKPAIALAGLFSPKEVSSYVYDYLVPNSTFVTGIFGAALIDATADKIKEVIDPIINNEMPKKHESIIEKMAVGDYDAESLIKGNSSEEPKEGQSDTPLNTTELENIGNNSEKEDPSIKSLLDSAIRESKNIPSKMLDLNASIENVKESASNAILSGTKMAYFKIGPFVLGPCYVGSVQLDFDFKNTDSQGCPTEGQVTLKDIYLPYTATNENILETLTKDAYSKLNSNTIDSAWEDFDNNNTRGASRSYK